MTQIEMILEKISRLQEVNESLIDRLNKLEDDMQFKEEDAGPVVEHTPTVTGLSKYEIKASMMIGSRSVELMRDFGIDISLAQEIGLFIVRKEVEWYMAATEGEQYNYWYKVYEELQSKS